MAARQTPMTDDALSVSVDLELASNLIESSRKIIHSESRRDKQAIYRMRLAAEMVMDAADVLADIVEREGK